MFTKLTRDQKLEPVRQLQQYFRDELDEEIGDLPADFLLDFVFELIGPFAYNQALTDARHIVADRSAVIDEEILALERPVPRRAGPA